MQLQHDEGLDWISTGIMYDSIYFDCWPLAPPSGLRVHEDIRRGLFFFFLQSDSLKGGGLPGLRRRFSPHETFYIFFVSFCVLFSAVALSFPLFIFSFGFFFFVATLFFSFQSFLTATGEEKRPVKRRVMTNWRSKLARNLWPPTDRPAARGVHGLRRWHVASWVGHWHLGRSPSTSSPLPAASLSVTDTVLTPRGFCFLLLLPSRPSVVCPCENPVRHDGQPAVSRFVYVYFFFHFRGRSLTATAPPSISMGSSLSVRPDRM